jgi:inhibitor of KinA sporulation pathway (predicted exonuclease)
METIEIGAVKLEGPSLQVCGEFQSFVRPVAEPVLSEFCVELTSIRQSDVDSAPIFPEALESLVEWVGTDPVVFCSWGAYDGGQIENDCRRHKVPFPTMLERRINLKKAFAQLHGIGPCGMKRALAILGRDITGSHHRAMDDARNIAVIARTVLPQLERT